jgi:hypothetical protein
VYRLQFLIGYAILVSTCKLLFWFALMFLGTCFWRVKIGGLWHDVLVEFWRYRKLLVAISWSVAVEIPSKSKFCTFSWFSRFMEVLPLCLPMHERSGVKKHMCKTGISPFLLLRQTKGGLLLWRSRRGQPQGFLSKNTGSDQSNLFDTKKVI